MEFSFVQQMGLAGYLSNPLTRLEAFCPNTKSHGVYQLSLWTNCSLQPLRDLGCIALIYTVYTHFVRDPWNMQSGP